MSEIEVFRSPEGLVTKFIDFFQRQPCYPYIRVQELRKDLKQYVGVYALYYHGNHSLYRCIRQANQDHCCLPIYVGKATTKGRRTGRAGGGEPARSSRPSGELYDRLLEHRRSIEQATNLELEDFSFRVAAMESDLSSWGESVLIHYFQPVWNQIIGGFGIHAPGGPRSQQSRSVWDQLHPGRHFTKGMPNADPIESTETYKQWIDDLCQRMRGELGCP